MEGIYTYTLDDGTTGTTEALFDADAVRHIISVYPCVPDETVTITREKDNQVIWDRSLRGTWVEWVVLCQGAYGSPEDGSSIEDIRDMLEDTKRYLKSQFRQILSDAGDKVNRL